MSIAPDLSCWSTSRTVFATPETPSASKPQPPAATTCSPRWRYWLCWEFKTLQGYTGLGVPEPSEAERSDDLEHATAAIERLSAMKDLRSMAGQDPSAREDPGCDLRYNVTLKSVEAMIGKRLAGISLGCATLE